jgi:hypothetical protein
MDTGNYAKCANVEEFITRFYKPERLTDTHGGCKEFKKFIVSSYEKELEETGVTSISRHDSVTGTPVYFSLTEAKGA